ncbi:response regulator [Chryseotalea sanaruensis]|uniref:Response regulator n=1 Tax=Chryseotalea sanaruensis TaxID=2482724 RepID=A0A401U6D7_9BACT|nr:response regulator [Chryseotalea sanaruensis]GCC50483.1 response regulator [Chryseotalea sanaruensis]
METQTGNKVIMLIDDDAITNMINTKVIKMNFNFNVYNYVNAQFALKQLEQWCHSSPENLPSVIFLDINMPIMDGWEFLEAFQKLPHSVHEKSKIFVLTSSIDVEDIEKAKTFHVVSDFLSKPLTAQKLKDLI